MTQVSRPLQIALVAALAVLAVWFVALRPKGEESSSTTASAPAATTATAPAATAQAPAPAAKPAPAPAPATHKAARPEDKASRALAHGKTVVLLVWNGRSADDRAAHAALAGLDHHHGKVVSIVTSPLKVARFAAITRGAEVSQSPTLVVVSPDRRARTIVGFTDATELNQVVADVLAA